MLILGLTKGKSTCALIPACDLPIEQTWSMLLIEVKLHEFFFKAVKSNKSKGLLLKSTPHERGQYEAVWQSSSEASRLMTRVWSWHSPHSILLLPTAGCTRKHRSFCTQEFLQWQSNFISHGFGFSGLFSFLNNFHPCHRVKLLINTVLQKWPLL